MGEKSSKEFEIVTIQQVKSLIQDNFPQLTTQSKSSTYQFFDIARSESPKGCFVSVKVPIHVTEAGEALHLLVKNEYLTKDAKNPELKTYVVYPSRKYMEKRGRGNKESLSVFRTKGWQRNLMLETRVGMDICRTLNESGKIYGEPQRQILYDLYMDFLDTTDAVNAKAKHCAELTRVSAKETCQKELKELEQTKISKMKTIRDSFPLKK